MDEWFENNAAARKNEPWYRRVMSWVAGHELSVLVAVALIIGGLWLTFVLADGVLEGDINDADTTVLLALRESGDLNNPLGPPWVEELFRDFTALGGTGLLTLIVVATAVYYLLQGRKREMALLVTAVLGAYALSFFLKGFFARPRPELVPPGDYIYSASFPSGHSLLAAATYLTLAGILAQVLPRSPLKAYVLLLALLITGLVGFSRVYLGVHYPSDVLAGWALGAVWAAAWWLLLRTLRRRGWIGPRATTRSDTTRSEK